MAFIEDLGARIRAQLQREQRRLNAEIGQYPAPIAVCDQQFNHLLIQRAAAKDELACLAALENNALSAGDAIRVMAEFIQNSTCLDADAKTSLHGRLQAWADGRPT
jgi:hypothetical protein